MLKKRQTAGESAGWRWDRSVLCLDTQCVKHHKHEEHHKNEGLLSQMRRGKSSTRAVFVMLLVFVMLRSCLRRWKSHACSACSTRLECTCSDTTPAQRRWRRKSPHIVRPRSRRCARWARSKKPSSGQAAATRSSGVVCPPSIHVCHTPRVPTPVTGACGVRRVRVVRRNVGMCVLSQNPLCVCVQSGRVRVLRRSVWCAVRAVCADTWGVQQCGGAGCSGPCAQGCRRWCPRRRGGGADKDAGESAGKVRECDRGV